MAGNKMAAMVRIEQRAAGAYEGQRRHDLREGALPGYVNRNLEEINSVIIEPPRASALRAINEERSAAARPGMRRAMRSDTAPAWVGIIAFGAGAQDEVKNLFAADQDRAFLDAARAVAERLGTTVEGLVVHRDESAVHARFTLAAYGMDGRPLSSTVKRGHLHAIQDDVARAFQGYAPRIERGTRLMARIEDGDDYAATVHKTVRELHGTLERDLEAKRAAVAEAAARVDEMRVRVSKLEEKADLTAKELKRLDTYRKRLDDRIAEQEAAVAESERVAAAIRSAAAQDRDEAAAARQAAQEDESQAAADRVAADAARQAAQAAQVAAAQQRKAAAEDAAKARREREAAEQAKAKAAADLANADRARIAADEAQTQAALDRDAAAADRAEATRLRSALAKALAAVKFIAKRVGLTAAAAADVRRVVEDAEDALRLG